MAPFIADLFPQQAPFSPEEDLSALLGQVPAKWVVYLFLDEAGTPFQLLCVKNLRASLARRLGAENELVPGRRVPYRQLVRGIAWQRVDSALEADLAYAEAAKAFFPSAYRQFIGSRRPWFVQISPQAKFPVFARTEVPAPGHGRRVFGPLPSRAAAQKFIEGIEDAFDLCRYPNILAQSPHGVACPYKQMHKCPAPCDGSIPLNLYCMQVDLALRFLESPGAEIGAHSQRMHAAAAALQFEQAGRIRQYVLQLQKLADARLVELMAMRYLAVLRGPRAATTKLMLASPLEMSPLLCLRDANLAACESSLELASQQPPPTTWDETCLDRLAILSYHRHHPMGDGVLVPMVGLSPAALQGIIAEFSKPRREPEPPADEGVIQDAQ